jgi:HK97 family phage major capsid protein
MNPTLKALHEKLQSLIDEGKTLANAASLDETQIARATEITAAIDTVKAQISAVTGLEGSTAVADEFLNGKTGGILQSVSSGMSEEDLRKASATDPESLFKATKKLAAKGLAPFLSAVLGSPAEAREVALGLGHFAIACMTTPNSAIGASRKWCEKNGINFQGAGQVGNINEDGGYLVPEEYESAIIVLREVYGVFRRYAQIVPMARDTKVEPRRTGGVTAYFGSEGGAMTDSKLAWDMVSLTARKLYALVYSSTELDEDATVSLGDQIAGEIAYAFAYKEDICGFNGDGTNATYGGITGVRQRLLDQWTTSGGAGLILGAGNAYSELTLLNFQQVQGALPIYAERNAKWFCSKVFWSTVLMKLALAAGGVPAAEIMMGGTKKFLGDEVVISQVMPTAEANSQVPIAYGSLDMAAMLGNRRGVTIDESAHYRFANDQLAYRGTQRFDINVHSVVTPGTSEAGPIVGLIMASG